MDGDFDSWALRSNSGDHQATWAVRDWISKGNTQVLVVEVKLVGKHDSQLLRVKKRWPLSRVEYELVLPCFLLPVSRLEHFSAQVQNWAETPISELAARPPAIAVELCEFDDQSFRVEFQAGDNPKRGVGQAVCLIDYRLPHLTGQFNFVTDVTCAGLMFDALRRILGNAHRKNSLRPGIR